MHGTLMKAAALAGALLLSVVPQALSRDAGGTDLGVPMPEKYAAKGVLRIGVRCDYPPMGFMDAAGRNAGLEVELAHGLARLAFGDRSKVDLTCVTSSNRIPLLTTERIDIILAALGYNPERARQIGYGVSYSRAVGQLLVKVDSGIDSTADLAGKTVILDTGTPYKTWFRDCAPNVKHIEFESTAQSLSALKQGRGDAYAQSDKTLSDIASKNPDLKVVGETYTSFTGPGLRKGDTELKAWLDAAINKLIDEDVPYRALDAMTTDPAMRTILADIVARPNNRQKFAYPDRALYVCP